jgi:HSP20 family protein
MSWINDDFEKIIERLFRQFGVDPATGPLNQGDPNVKSWYYGYTMTMGPDGKPVVREFGNGLPGQAWGLPVEAPQVEAPQTGPLTQVDVDRDQMKVRVLVEMPGVTKESIKVNATENMVRISAHHEHRDYDAEVPLNAKVDPASAKATYNNGVLDLSFDLVEAPKDDGVEVQVN